MTHNTHTLLRTEIKTLRQNLFENQILHARNSLLCQQNCILSPLWEKATHIALYHPIKGEVDTFYLAKKAYNSGKQVYYPRCEPSTCGMEFIHIPEKDFKNAFSVGNYGIKEPYTSFPATQLPVNSLVIVPCLAYNLQGYRLGYGKGFYDRFLATSIFYSIALAFSFQENNTFSVYAHDIKIQALANEKGLLCFQ